MQKHAENGDRLLLVPDDWGGDQLRYGVVVDRGSGEAWEVPIGTALKGGYWDSADGYYDVSGYEIIPWPLPGRGEA